FSKCSIYWSGKLKSANIGRLQELPSRGAAFRPPIGELITYEMRPTWFLPEIQPKFR
ncbi:hypothetical protein X798_05655, partial [Onchocerca flexuosa]